MNRLQKEFDIDKKVTKCVELGQTDRLFNQRRSSRRHELRVRKVPGLFRFLREISAKHPSYSKGQKLKLWESMDADAKRRYDLDGALLREESRISKETYYSRLCEAIRRNELYVLTVSFWLLPFHLFQLMF